VLRRNVGRLAGRADQPVHRGDVDDAAPVCCSKSVVGLVVPTGSSESTLPALMRKMAR
jgi:hypothetical protein